MAMPIVSPQKPKVTLTGVQSTLLITLYARHLDSLSAHPILNDPHATAVVNNISHDFSKIGVASGAIYTVGVRGHHLDNWVRSFLAKHPVATVVHLGCGLDTRAHRLDWSPSVRWIDVDLPDVVDLRTQVVPDIQGRDYTLLAGSATDEPFIAGLPNDRPTIVVMEGLTSYLDPVLGEKMVVALCTRFGEKGGEIVTDASSWLTKKVQKVFSLMWKTDEEGVQWVRWGIGPRGLEGLYDRLRAVEVVPFVSADTEARRRLGVVLRGFFWLLGLFRVTRETFVLCRYEF
ncbi:hypothetical protein OQA88_4378 [Cercophora sp. LCS_1]